MRQDLTIQLTTESEQLLEGIRERLRNSGRNVPNDVTIIDEALKVLEKELDTRDDAKWDEAFAKSQNYLDQWADEIQAKYDTGLTEDFDPDTDFDTQ